MNESLRQLVGRRLHELGVSRGRGQPLTLLEVWESLPEDANGKRQISYEICRRVANGDHRNIGDRAADAIATMLDVPVGDVLRAAGKRPRLGRFDLPRRADRLDERERSVVVSVVDAILNASEDGRHRVTAPEWGREGNDTVRDKRRAARQGAVLRPDGTDRGRRRSSE